MRPVPEPAGTFAVLLRQLRVSAGLTQEELARAAKLSYRSISDLERGVNQTARSQTARLLADALKLSGAARTRFEAAARGTSLAGSPRPAGHLAAGAMAVATRTLPRDSRNFTGREPELRALLATAMDAAKTGRAVSIHSIGGMAGVGKSTFAVHAAHQLAPWFPDGQVFLPLHAHTPGQLPVDPADALASLLLTAGIAPSLIPPGLEERVRLWRDHLAGRRLLLVLDDAAGHDQVLPLLPGTPGSLVLITSRKHLTALDDAHPVSLDTLPADQAAELLVQLASRADLTADNPHVREIARLCGQLPLAIGMLAKQLRHHPAWTATDLLGELTTTRDRLELMRAENLSVAAAFDLSYQDLAPDQQRLFRRLGLHPGTEIDAHAAAALDGASLGDTRRRLSGLYDHYLLAEPARGRFRMHDLVREHARLVAASDQAADRDAALDRLADYFVRVACTADSYLARHAPATVPADPQAQLPTPPLASRSEAIAWLDRERANLHALIADCADSGRPAAAATLARAMHAYLRFAGHWDQAAVQDALALDLASQLADQRAQAAAQANLGDLLLATRDYPAAVAELTAAISGYLALADPRGEAAARTALASAWYLAGDNRAAAQGLAEALSLCRAHADERGEALALSRLASVQLVTGDFAAANTGLTRALALYRKHGDRLGEAHARNDLGATQLLAGDPAGAAANLDQAFIAYRELGDRMGTANVLLDLAGVRHADGDHQAAIAGLTSALELYQELGDRLGKANVLNLLATVQLADGTADVALATAEQALRLYRDLGDRAGEAEALISVGKIMLASDTVDQAAARFEQARTIAAAVAAPPLAAAALDGLGRCLLKLGQRAEGAAVLTEALAVYQRIGSAAADQLKAVLLELDD